MAKFAGGSTYNFGLGVSGQTNGFFIPEIYSKKVQIALRKAAVAEAICNTDYMEKSHLSVILLTLSKSLKSQ